MDLSNWEFFANSGNAVVGATVTPYVASDTHPNPNAPAAAGVLTNASGKWSIVGLPDGQLYDIKVETAGGTQIKWYKANAKFNVQHLYDDTVPAVSRNLLANGGQQSWGRWVLAGSAPISVVGATEIADGWDAALSGGGDSCTGTRGAPSAGVNALYSAEFAYTRVGGQFSYSRTLPESMVRALRGKQISVSATVEQSADRQLRIVIIDSAGNSVGAATGAVATPTTITGTRIIDAGATSLTIYVATNAAGAGAATIKIMNVMMDYGAVAPVYALSQPDMGGQFARDVDRFLGIQTVNDTLPSVLANTGFLSDILNALAKQLRALSGSGDWKTAAAKVSRAGDVMTGILAFANDTQGVVFSGGGHIIDVNAVGTFFRANQSKLVVQNEAADKTMFQAELGLISAFNNAAASGAVRIYLENGTRYYTIVSNGTGGLLIVRDDSNTALSIGPDGAMTINGSVVWTDGNSPDRVTATQIAASAVGTSELADLAVTDGKIANGTITGPKIGDGQITGAKIQDGTVTDTDVAPANKDGLAGTFSMRTLGGGALQAAAGNHAHTGMAKSASSSYTGNGGATRSISGLGFAPRWVQVQKTTTTNTSMILMGHDGIVFLNANPIIFAAGQSIDGDGFTVTLGSGFNTSGEGYRWVALG